MLRPEPENYGGGGDYYTGNPTKGDWEKFEKELDNASRNLPENNREEWKAKAQALRDIGTKYSVKLPPEYANQAFNLEVRVEIGILVEAINIKESMTDIDDFTYEEKLQVLKFLKDKFTSEEATPAQQAA